MIINFTTPDGDDVCFADCIAFRTNKNNSTITVERETGIYIYKFTSSVDMHNCYQSMIESARKWAKL